MSLEKEKKENQKVWVMDLLNEKHKDEMSKILAFWEKYKREWANKKDNFWKKWNFGRDRRKFRNLVLDYDERKERFIKWLSKEEMNMWNNLDDTWKKKFFDEYLDDDIIYDWNADDEYEHWGLIDYSWWKDVDMVGIKDEIKEKGLEVIIKQIWETLEPWIDIDLSISDIGDDWIKILSKEWRDKLKPWMKINLDWNNISDEGVKLLAEAWKDCLQPWMTINLWGNNIWDEWVKVLAREWKDKLQPWMTINLSRNNIWADWLEILVRGWRDSLKQWMEIDLSGNILWDEWFGDEWLKVLVKEWKDNLQPGMIIDICNNGISDEWLEILANEWGDGLPSWTTLRLDWNFSEEWLNEIVNKVKLKDWISVIIWVTNLTKEMQVSVENWEKTYKDMWVNCSAYVYRKFHF